MTSIVKETKIPKSTVFGNIKDIRLTDDQKSEMLNRRNAILKMKANPRKGVSLPGRRIDGPISWDIVLIQIVAHFMVDGHVRECGCTYYNRSRNQVGNLKKAVKKMFGIKPILRLRPDGVMVMAFHNVEFAQYIKEKIKQVFSYLKTKASKEEKRTFLKVFFDDEGSVYFNSHDTRRVRGYQKSPQLLEEITCLNY